MARSNDRRQYARCSPSPLDPAAGARKGKRVDSTWCKAARTWIAPSHISGAPRGRPRGRSRIFARGACPPVPGPRSAPSQRTVPRPNRGQARSHTSSAPGHRAPRRALGRSGRAPRDRRRDTEASRWPAGPRNRQCARARLPSRWRRRSMSRWQRPCPTGVRSFDTRIPGPAPRRGANQLLSARRTCSGSCRTPLSGMATSSSTLAPRSINHVVKSRGRR